MNLEGLTEAQKNEVCTRALIEASKILVPAICQLSEMIDRLESTLKAMAKILSEEDKARWEKAINEAMKHGSP